MDRLTIGGTEFRVECNFNAITAYMDEKGESDLSFLTPGRMGMRDWLLMLSCCVNEGERLEGRRHDYRPEDFGLGKIGESVQILPKFIEIFGKQNAAEEAEAKKD